MIDWNYIVSQIATVAFDILYFGAIISTIVVIILDNRNPVKTMAWILILLFLPIVGLVFYFFVKFAYYPISCLGNGLMQ
jgi:cardiolipin synthase